MTLRHYRRHFIPPTPLPSLEHIADGSSLELGHEVSAAIQSFEHLHAQLAGLQDLHDAVGRIDHASQEHLLLIEAGLNLAHFDSHLSAETIAPGLESYLGQSVSMEGLNQRIKQLLAAIKRAMAVIAERIGEFLSSMLSDLGQLEMRLEHIQFKLDDIGGRFPTHQQVALGNDVYGVATDQGYPGDGHLLVRSLVLLQAQARMVYDHYVPTLARVGAGLNNDLHKLRDMGGNPEGWLQAINRTASAYDIHAFRSHAGKTGNIVDSRYPMGTAVVAQPLPGMRSMVFVDGTLRKDLTNDNPAIEAAYMHQASNVELVRASAGRAFDPATSTMQTMQVSQIQDTLRITREIVEEMRGFLNHTPRRALTGVLNDMRKAAEAIEAANPDSSQALTVGLQYVSAYQRWIKLFTDMLALTYTVGRASANVCVRHIHAYA